MKWILVSIFVSLHKYAFYNFETLNLGYNNENSVSLGLIVITGCGAI